MNFVSLDFAILFAAVLALLWMVKNAIARKLIILGATCVFYAYWDWRFLGLLALVTLLNYFVTVRLVASSDEKVRKALLVASIVGNLAVLAFFKYFNFFATSLNAAMIPFRVSLQTLNIILPLGISFYIFETLTYVIDVYNETAEPARSLLDYAIFITYFPRLVSGPIVRAPQFLPQLERGVVMNLENLNAGAQLFLRGMLKKIVVADNLAVMVDQIYTAPSVFSSPTMWLAIFAYSVQILCDFWGYTDMALGLGKMMGFDLPQNFNLPYVAQSVTEFWRRWHMTLSSWFRDYVFTPLQFAGRRGGWLRQKLNIMIVFLLTGLWHGASWNFVIWGGLHGLYIAIEDSLLGKKVKPSPWTKPAAWVRACVTFLLVSLTWVPFRSPNWPTTLEVFKKLLFIGGGYQIEWYFTAALLAVPLIFIGGLLATRYKVEWPILPLGAGYTPAVMLFEALIVFFLAPSTASPFIYFQF